MLNVLAPTFYKQIHTQIKAVRTTDRLFFFILYRCSYICIEKNNESDIKP